MFNCCRSVCSKLFYFNNFKPGFLRSIENIYFTTPRPLRQLNISKKWHCVGARELNIITEIENNNILSLKLETMTPDLQDRPEDEMVTPSMNYDKNLIYCVNASKSYSTGQDPEPLLKRRPSEEHLEHAFQFLSDTLPLTFSQPLDRRGYHENIILEDNIKGKRYVGIWQYVMQMALLRTVANFKFACVRYEILKITKHSEDGTIKCRWRIVGIPSMSVILQFWKYTPNNIQKILKESPAWYDGFSIYFVGPEGTIIKHIRDKMQPDDDRIEVDHKTHITPKVALFSRLPVSENQVIFEYFQYKYSANKNLSVKLWHHM